MQCACLPTGNWQICFASLVFHGALCQKKRRYRRYWYRHYEPTGVTCVVKKHAKGDETASEFRKYEEHGKGVEKTMNSYRSNPSPYSLFFSHPLLTTPHFLLTKEHSFARFPLLENKFKTSASQATTRELLAAEMKSSFVSRSVIWNKINVC